MLGELTPPSEQPELCPQASKQQRSPRQLILDLLPLMLLVRQVVLPQAQPQFRLVVLLQLELQLA